MYAKITIIEDERIPTIKLFASKHKERLSESGTCEYVYTGWLNEFNIAKFLKDTKTTEFEIPNEIMETLSVGFYRNYESILNIT